MEPRLGLLNVYRPQFFLFSIRKKNMRLTRLKEKEPITIGCKVYYVKVDQEMQFVHKNDSPMHYSFHLIHIINNTRECEFTIHDLLLMAWNAKVILNK